MNFCTLPEVKGYLAIDHDADDAMLGLLISTSSDAINAYLSTEDGPGPWADNDNSTPHPRVVLATALMVSLLYRDREGVDNFDNGQLPSGVRALLSTLYVPVAR
ncbi:phage gp6-like head-tail connector protein [Halomonas daqingensis]|uniref:Phage gp6-like head-tail connector protein n=1 Tax=Billgrantia desiderata TaxID=52021 RepID=A0AAW4YUU4_9GAMM|nr:head-tail connector protein [Halomonas desiderata]MCE8052281.1 phage gp6-like head-tail connector protein [Halomonas desiderata]